MFKGYLCQNELYYLQILSKTRFTMQGKQIKRIIVDTDVGTDDYVALMILLYAEKQGILKIEAIICSNGNTTTSHVTRNVIRLLEIVERTDIAVYKGADEPLILPREHVKKFHGTDGFGDLQYDKEPNVGLIKNTPGSIIIHDIVIKNPDEISIICLGPLTTLALAIKLYNDITNKIKDVWIMGGNCRAVGNVTSTAEFNFFIDSEAAHIVLECLKCKIFILPWEPCLQPNISMEWRCNALGNNTAVLSLLSKAEKKLYQGYNEWIPCDGFLVYCFLNPELYIIRQSIHHATIELYSSHTRGQMVLDHMKNKNPNVIIIEEFNKNLFMELLLEVKNTLC